MKYEKFEKWMVGKKFYNKFDPEDIGVIIGEGEGEGVLEVVYEIDGPSRASLCNIIFVDSAEEKPSDDKATTKEGIQIEWEVGQEVWDTVFGVGEVVDFDEESYSEYPVKVRFENGCIEHFTKEGKIFKGCKRSLFFSEPVVTAELFPPKKPFKSMLKVGDVLVVQHVMLLEEKYVLKVESEDEECVWFVGEDNGYLKTAWTFHKLGEEIKFES